MTQILAFLAAIPTAISLAKEIWDYLVKLSGGDVAGFLLKSSAAFQQLNKATTQQEHEDAAKAIAGLIGQLPPK